MCMTNMEDPLVDSFLIIFVFQFVLISRFKHFDLSLRLIYFFNCDLNS